MKKSLLALAVLGAFAGAASAQSSVTLYGRVDLSAGKGAGVEQQLAGQRLGQPLRCAWRRRPRWGPASAVQHRAPLQRRHRRARPQQPPRFWHGRSIVGLQGGFGQIVLGREYTPAFLQSQLVADPWGWDTVVAGSLGGSGGNTSITGGGVGIAIPGNVGRPAALAVGLANVRNDSSITYKITLGGFTFGAQIAEATDATQP